MRLRQTADDILFHPRADRPTFRLFLSLNSPPGRRERQEGHNEQHNGCERSCLRHGRRNGYLSRQGEASHRRPRGIKVCRMSPPALDQVGHRSTGLCSSSLCICVYFLLAEVSAWRTNPEALIDVLAPMLPPPEVRKSRCSQRRSGQKTWRNGNRVRQDKRKEPHSTGSLRVSAGSHGAMARS